MTKIPEEPAPHFIMADKPGEFAHLGPSVKMMCQCHRSARPAIIYVEGQGWFCEVPESVCL